MPRFVLHQAVRQVDLAQIDRLLAAPDTRATLNTPDDLGRTPLQYAIATAEAGAEVLRLLLRHGATFDSTTDLSIALRGGDLAKVKVLLEARADIQYRSEHGYDALIDAVHGRDILHDPRLMVLLEFLIDQHVALDTRTAYGETAIGTLSSIGRFDAVKLMIDAGASAAVLRFGPVLSAVAFGSLGDVGSVLEAGANVEERDHRSRTAWLLAVQMGDRARAELLRERGADTSAVGHFARSALSFAITNGHTHLVPWLIAIGADIEHADQSGETSLMTAIECSNAEVVEILLQAGANVHVHTEHQSPMRVARTREIALRLLQAGADQRGLSAEGTRAILGYLPGAAEDLPGVSDDDYRAGCRPRPGVRNPEVMQVPFWTAMVLAGMTASQARSLFAEHYDLDTNRSPVWCAHRFGQSLTLLADGRVIQIGGVHEDFYDVDFCIYNDVIVHDAQGNLNIYGYPQAAFAPTDFHSATLVGTDIFVVGCLGYADARRPGETPVYRLDTRTYEMHPFETTGDKPGWIHAHAATHLPPHEIQVVGGKFGTTADGEETLAVNTAVHVLNLETRTWRLAAQLT